MESPEWTPARSMCSMMPGMSSSSPSKTPSTSTSRPMRYLSTRMGCSCSTWLMMRMNSVMLRSL